MRAPLVLGEKSQQISGEVADYHEGKIVEYETHDALPKTGIAPAILYHQVSREAMAMALKFRPTGLKHSGRRAPGLHGSLRQHGDRAHLRGRGLAPRGALVLGRPF
jgi:hypothetical protein